MPIFTLSGRTSGRKRRCGLARDERGVSVVEFALVLPVLAFLTMGTIDFGRGFASKYSLEQAAQRTIEMANVGAVGSDYNYLKPEAASVAGVPVENVTVDQWLECDGGAAQDFTSTCSAGQMVARYVRLTIVRDYQPSFNYSRLGFTLANRQPNGAFRLSADSVVRVQ